MTEIPARRIKVRRRETARVTHCARNRRVTS